jgi:cytosine/adenosine deaminase-related metal-dependent hydrolase
MSDDLILSAARLLTPQCAWLKPGALLLRNGRIEEVGDPAALKARHPSAARIDLPGHALLPGLVNAHAHLELSGLQGRTPRGLDFSAWVSAMIAQRAQLGAADLESAARHGALSCLANGTTTVGDFDASGAAERALGAAGEHPLPRTVLFCELLDGRDPARTSAALERAGAARRSGESCWPALAPHAAHTVSPALLEAVARRAQTNGWQLSTHWAETAEEGQWLEHGRGPFANLLGASPRRSGLDLLADACGLGARLTLVHGNLAKPEEIARIARGGAGLVHCPGSHAFFERAPFALRAWLAAGVPVALGTDSLASNDSLDLRRELRLLRGSQPWLEARDAWNSVSLHAARALGLSGQVGELSPGALGDVLAVPSDEREDQRCLERVAHGDFEIAHIWLGGRPAPGLVEPPVGDTPAMGCAPGSRGPG